MTSPLSRVTSLHLSDGRTLLLPHMATSPDIELPAELIPADGRFGSGPARIDRAAIDALAATGESYLGTSHRSKGVRSVVRAIRRGLDDLYDLPDGYEILLGVGGTTAFWGAATHGLVERHSQHLVFGEFSRRFANVAAGAPWLAEPEIIEAQPGTHPLPRLDPEVDAYGLTHNETSTGVSMPIARPKGAEGLVLVDATSAAGAVPVDATQFDAYYFSPQKALGSEGGLWIAMCSPHAVARIETVRSGRWVPPFLDLGIALENSRKDQTYNTPALSTLFLLRWQIDRLLDNGGMTWAAERSRRNSELIYLWAEKSAFATPFVRDIAMRSTTTVTIDIEESISVEAITGVLRHNGIVDLGGYRKLGRNQLRVATFPNVDLEDLDRLVRAVDFIAERLGGV